MYPSRDDWLYTAGLFDGEGSIMITKSPPNKKARRRSLRHSAALSLASTDLPVLEWLRERFGGTITRLYPVKATRAAWEWRIGGSHKVREFIVRLRPYLKVKATQSWLLLEFLTNISPRQGSHRVSEGELALREGYYWAMKGLNHPVTSQPLARCR